MPCPLTAHEVRRECVEAFFSVITNIECVRCKVVGDTCYSSLLKPFFVLVFVYYLFKNLKLFPKLELVFHLGIRRPRKNRSTRLMVPCLHLFLGVWMPWWNTRPRLERVLPQYQERNSYTCEICRDGARLSVSHTEFRMSNFTRKSDSINMAFFHSTPSRVEKEP